MKKAFLPFLLLLLVMMASCSAPSQNRSFILATYNLRLSNQGDSVSGNGWGPRLPYVASLIRFHEFDLFGTQEGKYHQLEGLKAELPGYTYIGVGRDDGKIAGEFAAIFYNTEKFDLLDTGDFWLSEHPDVPGELGWDAACPRVCTWGKFRIKESGFTFIYYNLHMDHIGVQARAESARMILDRIQENPEKLPTILTGDFNINQENEAFKLLDESGILNDAYRIARLRYINSATYNAFSLNRYQDLERIDHLFLTAEFSVRKYGVLTDSYRALKTEKEREVLSGLSQEEASNPYIARNPSDHYPVMAVVEY